LIIATKQTCLPTNQSVVTNGIYTPRIYYTSMRGTKASESLLSLIKNSLVSVSVKTIRWLYILLPRSRCYPARRSILIPTHSANVHIFCTPSCYGRGVMLPSRSAISSNSTISCRHHQTAEIVSSVWVDQLSWCLFVMTSEYLCVESTPSFNWCQ